MDNKRFRVGFYQDNIYEVFERKEIYKNTFGDFKVEEISVYQGSLADCDAYIRLVESGYME